MSIPFDHDRLVDVLAKTSASRYNEVHAALLAENPDNPAAVDRLFEGACSEAMHLANIATTRSNLCESLRQLELQALDALKSATELVGLRDDSPYVGMDGQNLVHSLTELARGARLATVQNRHILRLDDPDYAIGGGQ